ncbi:MAG: class I SAM-dependent methyltransferase [Bacillota bacterium]
MVKLERPASAVQWARVFIHPSLVDGAVAVDATAGNGHDTLFLAENVGPGGKVYALDIQEEALRAAMKRLDAAGVCERVFFLQRGHEEMGSIIDRPVDAVMFNLGYLPGGDKTVATKPGTTIAGLTAAMKLLRPGGRMSVVAYTGHAGAREEAGAVGRLLSGVEEKNFHVQKMVFWNSCKDSPELYFVTRTGDNNE